MNIDNEVQPKKGATINATSYCHTVVGGEIQPLKRGSNDLRYLSFIVYRSGLSWGRTSQSRSGVER